MTQRTCDLHDEAGAALTVSVQLGLPDHEGWMPCHVDLVRGDRSVGSSDGQIRDVDLDALAKGLRATAASGTRLRWAPAEPLFLVWAERYERGEVEIIVMADEGLSSDGPSTDTGVALVLSVKGETLEAFADSLAG